MQKRELFVFLLCAISHLVIGILASPMHMTLAHHSRAQDRYGERTGPRNLVVNASTC